MVVTISEIDVDKLVYERRRIGTFTAGKKEIWRGYFDLELEDTVLTRSVEKNPFVPADRGDREARCQEILTIAALGLKKRLAHTHAKTAVVGLSGGLDSTLALLITARAMDLLGRPRTDITAITMPCFGTTSRTKSNAQILAERIGTTFREIDIGPAVKVHFQDIGQSMDDLSVTFENLNNPLRPKIGITSDSLPVSEKHYGGRRHEWAFLRLLRSEYDVVSISPQTAEIPYDVETLILINPHRLSPLFAYALDQYLLRGGRIILFADVYSETEAEIYGTASENSGQINRLLKNWGVSVNFAKVIGDRSLGENLVSGSESGEKLSNLPTWLNLNGSAINEHRH